jgi:hypothetical protein
MSDVVALGVLRVGQVEHDGALAEESARARQPGVKLAEPVADRRRRREHECQIGAADEPHGLTLLLFGGCGHGLSRGTLTGRNKLIRTWLMAG